MKKSFLKFIVFVLLCSFFGFFSCQKVAWADWEVRSIYFPTDLAATFTDSFGDARSGHLHEGIDMMGKKMTPLYSAIDGKVRNLEIPEASWGYAITLEDADGYTYHYLHVNNDTPGTDDGLGGVDHAYAPFVGRGAAVRKGQLIGWMGDSGNAENVGSHLHFEIRRSDGTAINPYQSLTAALKAGGPAPASVTTPVPSSTNSTVVKITATKFVFKNNLYYGLTHKDVKELQKFLNAHGFVVAKTGYGSPGHESTYFGQATRAALIKFQKAKKISPAAGYFGPLTRKVVNGM
jgi:hypothetical protein